MDLTSITSLETIDYMRGADAARKGQPFDPTETEPWKAGWQVWSDNFRTPRLVVSNPAPIRTPRDIAGRIVIREIAAALQGELA